MVQSIEKLFPFLENGDFIKTTNEVVNIDDIYCPITFERDDNVFAGDTQNVLINAVKIQPCNMIMINEVDSVVLDIMKNHKYGQLVKLNITEIDYTTVAQRIEVVESTACININSGYLQQDIVSDVMINASCNGVGVDEQFLADIAIEPKGKGEAFVEWLDSFSDSEIVESAKYMANMLSINEDFNDLMKKKESGESLTIDKSVETEDYIYKWLDSYFAMPEGMSPTSGGREVVPLLIGPTGVFKSATVKELCKKYDYRLVDFRCAFTSRLDYSGLYQMGIVDDKKYSYACPMEEIVTCSDGFREYCRRAYEKVSDILSKGYIETHKASDGVNTEVVQESITDEQRDSLEKILSSYKEYMKVPVLFMDEITRVKDAGVEGLLTELLNQKRFNNMQMQGCKFVAATNLNLKSRTNTRHNDQMEELDRMYDVNTEIDAAYANRFLPLRVQPEDVADRWFEWARKEKPSVNGNKTHIHPVILEFLENNPDMVYNDMPVIELLERGMGAEDNETRSQSYPNYRTWDMLSDYIYTIDEDYEVARQASPEDKADDTVKKTYKTYIIAGLISQWGADKFVEFLRTKGYVEDKEVNGEAEDEYTDFLESTLDSGVPALMVGPSSMGKTSRVKAYIKNRKKKTGLEPIMINVDLSSKDAVDLMGMPSKVSLVDYVCGQAGKSVPGLSKELEEVLGTVTTDYTYGLADTLTVRSPDKDIKDRLLKAKQEGREVVFMFDECNRVKNTTVLSALFEIISDQRFAGIDFSDMKDKVKIVAACNMTHQEMEMDDDMVGYSSTGALDPALAARFSIFWKKKYDEKDVKSWISFMEAEYAETDENGNHKIDKTLIDYFKTIPIERAVEILASVEKRQIAYACPSTRNLHQLSMDIVGMRGKSGDSSKLYYGKLLFDDITRTELGDIIDNIGAVDNVTLANKVIQLTREILDYKDCWDAVVGNKKISMGGVETTAVELMSDLEQGLQMMVDMVMRPLTSEENKKLEDTIEVMIELLNNCNQMDNETSGLREQMFEAYLGESFAREFTPYFNENFGGPSDSEITIEMLSDKTLIKPFFKKYRSGMSAKTEEQYEDTMLPLMQEFLSVHGSSLSPEHYLTFINTMKASLASSDGMDRILKGLNSSVDTMFVKAEEAGGDDWIADLLKAMRISKTDVENMRSRMRNVGSSTRVRKSVVL